MRWFAQVLVVFALGATQVLAARLPGVRADLLTFPFGKLTQFWAHQAAGIPEGHAFIKKLEHNNFAFATSQLGVLDTGFMSAHILENVRLTPDLHQHLTKSNPKADDRYIFARTLPRYLRNFLWRSYRRAYIAYHRLRHGSAIAHLLAGKSAAGVSLKGEIALLFPFPYSALLRDRKKLRELLADLPLPQVVNYSLRFSSVEKSSSLLAESMLPLAEKTILVSSAGNKSPAPIEAGKQKLAEHAIIVSSADPTGHASSFAQTGCAETIRACSDIYLQSVSPRSGKFFNFGGTSGAAPMVSAALADALSILPDLSRDQAAVLLQKTAVRNAYGDEDEVGLLNYYKLLRVAHRLVERGWSAAAGAEEVLHDPALYDFRAEAEQLTQEAVAASDDVETFRKLRQAFFLDDTNSTARRLLADIYRQHGYQAQAFYYDNPDAEARQAFIDQQEQQHQAITDKFLTAIATANLDTMQALLPEIDSKYLVKKKSKTMATIIEALPAEQQAQVINFLHTQKIAAVSIDDDDKVSIGRLLD